LPFKNFTLTFIISDLRDFLRKNPINLSAAVNNYMCYLVKIQQLGRRLILTATTASANIKLKKRE